MSWDTIAARIPHVFETIFNHLELQDRLSVASTCRQWQTAIFGRSSRLSKDIVLNVTYDRYSPLSGRHYPNVTVKPWIWGRRKLELSLMVLETMNCLACPVRWARLDGRFAEWDIGPGDLIAYGKVFSHLQVLELNLTLKTFWHQGWDRTFENLSGLRSVKLTGGHGRVLSSVGTYCRGLKKLELVQFALTKPLGELFDFPELEELRIQDLDVAPCTLGLKPGESQLVYQNLKHLTFLLSHYANFANFTSLASTISAPNLQSARVTDNLHRFVRIQAGEKFHDLTLNIRTNYPPNFTPNIIFRDDLSTISKLTVETYSMRSLVETVMNWINDHCSNVTELVFDQELSPPVLQQITDFVTRRMAATLTTVVNNSNVYHKSCFALERAVLRRGANQQQGNQNHLHPNFVWN